MKIQKLKDWFEEIYIGETMNRKAVYSEYENEKSFKTLMPKAIYNGYIDDSKIMLYEMKDEKKKISDKKLTHAGDIILKLVNPYSAVLIDKDHEGLVVPSFCLILRGCKEDEGKPELGKYQKSFIATKESNLNYMLVFLNSDLFRNQMQEALKIGELTTLSKSMVENVDVPFCSRAGRKKLSEAFEYYSNNIRLTRKLIDLQNEYITALFDDVQKDEISDIYEESFIGDED